MLKFILIFSLILCPLSSFAKEASGTTKEDEIRASDPALNKKKSPTKLQATQSAKNPQPDANEGDCEACIASKLTQCEGLEKCSQQKKDENIAPSGTDGTGKSSDQ